jgi:hypothetical protein
MEILRWLGRWAKSRVETISDPLQGLDFTLYIQPNGLHLYYALFQTNDVDVEVSSIELR